MALKILFIVYLLAGTTFIFASECTQLYKHEYIDLKKDSKKILWFATWCKPCVDKILKLSPSEFSETTVIGTHDSPRNIEKAYQFFAKKVGASNNSKHCFFDKKAKIAELYGIDDFTDSTKNY